MNITKRQMEEAESNAAGLTVPELPGWWPKFDQVHALTHALSLIAADRARLITKSEPNPISPHLDLVELNNMWDADQTLRRMLAELTK